MGGLVLVWSHLIPPARDPSRAHILVVEDSSVFREMQGLLLAQAGLAVSTHDNTAAALQAASRQRFEVALIDYDLPGAKGGQFVQELRQLQPDVAVIYVSAALNLELAVQLASQGVAGVFNKPAHPKTLLDKINETLVRRAPQFPGSRWPFDTRGRESKAPFSPLALPSTEPPLDRPAYPARWVLGASQAYRDFTHRAWKVRDFRAVLMLQGESGSPFILLARDLIDHSIFRDGATMLCDGPGFTPSGLIACLAPTLLSHHAGTLVVTGVESFTTEQQKTLTTLISGREIFQPFARRFRLVLAATHDLAASVENGSFDETLYYKISSLSLSVPPLCEMRGDIELNARRILASQRERDEAVPLALSTGAAAWLSTQDWPGNYDQLVHTLTAAVRQSQGDELTLPAVQAAYQNAGAAAKSAPATADSASAAALAKVVVGAAAAGAAIHKKADKPGTSPAGGQPPAPR